MKKYKTYLFDADGTLLDTSELIYRSFANTCRIHGGFEVDRETIFKDVGIPLVTQLKKLLGDLTENRLNEILETHRSYQKEIYRDSLRLYSGVKEGLEKLKSDGAQLGIVTSRNRESLDRYLLHTGIDGLFEVIASPETTENHKPHPEPVLWAMNELGASSDETVFIGDAVFDILSGNHAGVDTALITWGHNDPEEIEADPTWMLHRFEDLFG